MIEKDRLRAVADTAWSVYRQTMRWMLRTLADVFSNVIYGETGGVRRRRRRTHRLRSSLSRAGSGGRMLRRMEKLLADVAAGSARPGAVVLTMRSLLGTAGYAKRIAQLARLTR